MAVRTKHAREIQQLSMRPKTRELLKLQAEEADMTISEYVESLVLEKDLQKKLNNNSKSMDEE